MVRLVTGSMPSNGSSRNSEPRPVEQRRPERQLLLHPVAVVADQQPRLRPQVEALEELAAPRVDHLVREAVHAADEAQVLRARQAVEQRRAPRASRRSGASPRAGSARGPGPAPGSALGGPQEARGEVDRGGLAGAVAAQQAQEGAGLEPQAEPRDRGLAPEALRDRDELQAASMARLPSRNPAAILRDSGGIAHYCGSQAPDIAWRQGGLVHGALYR